jgi:hypothetical protein
MHFRRQILFLQSLRIQRQVQIAVFVQMQCVHHVSGDCGSCWFRQRFYDRGRASEDRTTMHLEQVGSMEGRTNQ